MGTTGSLRHFEWVPNYSYFLSATDVLIPIMLTLSKAPKTFKEMDVSKCHFKGSKKSVPFLVMLKHVSYDIIG